MPLTAHSDSIPRFDRRFFSGEELVSAIGTGGLGGKASGLLLAREALAAWPEAGRFAALAVDVPRFVVIATDVFDAFVERNDLRRRAAEAGDERALAVAFQRAELPAEWVGDLWQLVREARQPLAVRSSSLLEDALAHPFAGVYATKMTPNNQPDAETRFRKLVEALKLVYASCFFRGAREYARAAGRAPDDEKMAVMLQEVVGRRHGPRFYPDLSGVARSWNFYPVGRARPEQGVLELALGLGKTIVDGERCWTCSPALPRVAPPFASTRALVRETQTRFWAVNMGAPPAFDPVAEAEYLLHAELADAEYDGTLGRLASTYDAQSDRLSPGLGAQGARVLNFAPLLHYAEPPLAPAVASLLRLFAERLGTDVEIELAASFAGRGDRHRLGFLQVRPMPGAGEAVAVAASELEEARNVVASDRVMGHGARDGLRDVVYVRPRGFEARHTRAAAAEVAERNRALVEAGRPYVLIGFGRWGSSDPWLGIPVDWPQVSGAAVIVEASLPELNVEPSQGSHFFHNLLSFRVSYLSVPLGGRARIDWDWLEALPASAEGEWVRHVEVAGGLEARIDGRSGRGLVRRAGG